jgi:hypothetical protein
MAISDRSRARSIYARCVAGAQAPETERSRFLRESGPLNLLTGPVVYSMIVPIALIDVWISLYQAICFRAYGIARVRRSRYIVLDRQQLAYLNAIEKLNCAYCGYANGVFAYVREIAGRTSSTGISSTTAMLTAIGGGCCRFEAN